MDVLSRIRISPHQESQILLYSSGDPVHKQSSRAAPKLFPIPLPPSLTHSCAVVCSFPTEKVGTPSSWTVWCSVCSPRIMGRLYHSPSESATGLASPHAGSYPKTAKKRRLEAAKACRLEARTTTDGTHLVARASCLRSPRPRAHGYAIASDPAAVLYARRISARLSCAKYRVK